ncbi:unnamed protein product [Cuscuta epithymum]|uniref:Reverse transcriptase domain-containing protein n=1 Tax=Cuscuta epithymum TaxID=186058 RepID=A0AAV0C7E5_9ASTE|nr:unnamed protein product [Cuscuta epithymum]
MFSRGVNHLMLRGSILPFSVARDTPIISHLAFADDLFIFLNGSSSSLREFRIFLEAYQEATGLQEAYSCKLWWNWKMRNSLWSHFMHRRYPRGDNMIPKLPDSPVWRRICSIHNQCLEFTHVATDGTPIWSLSSDGSSH